MADSHRAADIIELDGPESVHRTTEEQRRYAARRAAVERRRRRKRRRRVAIVVLTCLLVFIIGMIAWISISFRHSDKDVLAGTWSPDLVTFYSFDGQGFGSMQTSLSDYAFSYELKEQAVVIDFTDDKVSDAAYSYTISEDGNSLILIAYDGTVFEMIKQP